MKPFRLEVRVPYAHTDQMRFVYYAHYLVYFEMARTAFLREHGMPYSQLEKRGVLLPVLEAHCEYKQPARYEDLLAIEPRFMSWKGPRLRIEYAVYRLPENESGEEELLATGHTTHVLMSPEGRVLRPLPELKALAAAGGRDIG